MRLRLLDYQANEYWIEIPDDTEFIEGEIISGDMVVKSPIEFDTGEWTRWTDCHLGSFRIPTEELKWFNSIESYYELLKKTGI